MIKLYDYELSANCYKVRLLAQFLDVALERIPIDVYPGEEHRSAAFRRINPGGEVPVLDDAGRVFGDAHAALVYLAGRYDASGRWCDRGDATLAHIVEWLGFAARLGATAGDARLHDDMFLPADIDACRRGAHVLFRRLDEHLWFGEQEDRDWLCSRHHPTIADIACFPDVMLSEEGGISRLPYPAIRRWTDRLKHVPGFTLMPGVFGAAPDAASAPLSARP